MSPSPRCGDGNPVAPSRASRRECQMDYHVSSRVRTFGTSIFSEMRRLAVQHGAVNLGEGFPDFPGPDFVKDAAKKAIDADLNQYAVGHGAPRLRRAIAATWARDGRRELDP